MSLLGGIADALRQMAGQATAGEYVVLGNRLAQAADLIGDIDTAGTGLEGLPPDQNEEIRDLLNIGVSFGATEYLAFRAGATTIALANPVTGLVLFVGFLVFEEALESTLQFLHQEWGITLIGENIDYSNIDHPLEILGTIVDDTFVSTTHDDTIRGLAGNDQLSNAGGSDHIFGGFGQDTVDYSSMTFSSVNGIVLDASTGGDSFVVHHHADTDVVENVEHIVGTSLADAFVLGNYGANIAGGGHIESIDAGSGDDVALLLNEGGAGPRRVAIEGGAGLDTVVIADDGFDTEIDFASGTVRYHGGAGARFSIAGFEAARGGDGSDVMLGGDDAEYLLGNEGADRLFGGGADDFIFFDAEDTAVEGGAGRDVAVALGTQGVTVDMAAQGLECVIGCDGADTITVAGAEDCLFAAGGGGADTFNMVWGEGDEGPRVMWGGAGADTFVFDDGMNGGIAVVGIAGLTEELFASLTLADLGLGNLNLDLFRAIIINPDEQDRVIIGGSIFSASGVPGGDYRSAVSPLQTAELGRSLTVQGFYVEGYMEDIRPVFEWDEMENILSISYFNGTWDSGGDPIMEVDEYDPLGQADQEEAMDLYEYYQINPYDVWIEPSLHPDYNPMGAGELFVVGGRFDGASLSENGALTALLSDDPGPSPFDWLLAA